MALPQPRLYGSVSRATKYLCPGKVVPMRSQFGMGARSQLKEVQVDLRGTEALGQRVLLTGASLVTAYCFVVPPSAHSLPFPKN